MGGGGEELLTVTVTSLEVVVWLAVSRARALSLWVPLAKEVVDERLRCKSKMEDSGV